MRSLLLAAATAALVMDASVAAQPPEGPAVTGDAVAELRYRHGRLSYRRRSTGEERGREDWQLTVNRDGTRTLRCLAMTDDSRFVRDVTYTLGTDRRPLDVFVRLQVSGEVVGRGYFFLGGDILEATTDARDSGHTEQRIPVPGPIHVMTHAVMLDGWSVWSYDLATGGRQELPVYNTSTRWNGTDGPLGRLEHLDVTFIGEEGVTVPAGTFLARHFTIDTDFVDAPTSHIWVTGEDNLLVRYDWPDYDLEYVLVSLVGGEERARDRPREQEGSGAAAGPGGAGRRPRPTPAA